MTSVQEQFCKMMGCSPEQLRRQYEANAIQLAAMRDKASKTGKKVNGYTLAQLIKIADRYKNLASMTD